MLAAGLSGSLSADTIVYSGARSAGSATATISITTDGTLGPLSLFNIIDWKIKLSDVQNTSDLLGPLGGANSEVFILGTAFTATATQLLVL